MFHLNPRVELHPVFEALGYTVGFATYRRARRNWGDVVTAPQRWTLIAAAAIGGLAGSRILGLLEQAPGAHITLTQILTPSGGKTIVGGLLGGWLSVEIVKWMEGIRSRTGDLFAIPLCVGIGIGRIGCLFAGLADDTYGTPTSKPWAVDFGDGVARHPTQAYEIVFLAALAAALLYLKRRPYPNGMVFRCFMAAYLTWRLLIDFLKPEALVAGMNLVQWACVAGLIVLIATRSGSFSGVEDRTGRDYA